MAFNESISLQKYVDSANQEFNKSEDRLSQIESSFQTRMNGKTIGGLIGAMIGTVIWLVVFCVIFWYIRGYVDDTLNLVYLGVAAALVITLFIDELIGFSYYGKILSYKNNIKQLKNRVSVGRSYIKSNHDTFMESRANGWRHPLSVGTSIHEEAASIESTIYGMESLKGGFINGLKNVLYFTFIIAITGIGSWALFGTAEETITSMVNAFDGSIDGDTMMALCVIGLLVAEVGIVILAKMWWSHTDCSVTNITLLIAPLGPVLFFLLVAVVAFLVMLVMWTIGIVIAIAAVALVSASVCGASSGG